MTREMRLWESKFSSICSPRHVLVDISELKWESKRSHTQAGSLQEVPVEWQQSNSNAFLRERQSDVGAFPKAMPAGNIVGSFL